MRLSASPGSGQSGKHPTDPRTAQYLRPATLNSHNERASSIKAGQHNRLARPEDEKGSIHRQSHADHVSRAIYLIPSIVLGNLLRRPAGRFLSWVFRW
jgi:hypothetical protein